MTQSSNSQKHNYIVRRSEICAIHMTVKCINPASSSKWFKDGSMYAEALTDIRQNVSREEDSAAIEMNRNLFEVFPTDTCYAILNT